MYICLILDLILSIIPDLIWLIEPPRAVPECFTNSKCLLLSLGNGTTGLMLAILLLRLKRARLRVLSGSCWWPTNRIPLDHPFHTTWPVPVPFFHVLLLVPPSRASLRISRRCLATEMPVLWRKSWGSSASNRWAHLLLCGLTVLPGLITHKLEDLNSRQCL